MNRNNFILGMALGDVSIDDKRIKLTDEEIKKLAEYKRELAEYRVEMKETLSEYFKDW